MKLGFWSSVSFHPEIHLWVWQPRGTLDEAHVEQLISMIEQAEDEAEQPFNRYTDLSKLDAIDVTFDYVFRVSLYRRVSYGERAPVKSAFYVTDRETARLALTHAVVTKGSPLKVKIFTMPEAAAKWLGVSVADLELAR